MNALRFIAVFIGAGVGACVRYALSFALNPLLVALPLGTLASNLVGGYLAGIATGYFLIDGTLPTEYRLFVITGLLGGLTTFSAFSVEMVALLQAGRTGAAIAGIGMHVLGSLLLTALGFMTIRSVLGTAA